MPVLSTFQRLPLLIAEEIIKYYAHPYRLHLRKEWAVLYDVCYSWRILALQRFCQRVLITASAEIGEDRLELPDKPSQLKMNHSLFRHVKDIDVEFNHDSQNLNGAQPNDFSATLPKDLVFPTARSLYINVTGFLEHYETINEIPSPTEFMWIAQRIRTTMPILQKVSIYGGYVGDMDQWATSRTHWNAGNLLPAIFEVATSVFFRAKPLCSENIDPFVYNCSNIVQLEFDCEYNVNLFHHIARESAATLETMKIYVYPFQTMEPLIADDKGMLIVFPRLHTLYFESYAEYDESASTTTIDNTSPVFPVLRRLTLESHYPFADDILFRGNNDALEYLDIELDAELVDVLENHNVFSAGKHPYLSHVIIRKGHSASLSRPDKELYLKHTASLLLPAIQFLSLPDMFTYQEIYNAIFKTVCLRNIQFLDIDCIDIGFYEILDLTKLLPNLIRPVSSSSSIYPELQPNTSRIDAFVEDVYKDYYPLSSRFKLWIHELEEDEFIAPLALASVVLAVVCPAFAYTMVPRPSRRIYNRKLEVTISSISNTQHHEALEHLFKQSVEYQN